MELLKGIL